MNTQQILQNYGLKFEELSSDERATLNNWVHTLENNNLTVDVVREYVEKLIGIIEEELTSYEPKTFLDLFYRKKRRIYLDARLKNLLLLRDMLATPLKARKALDKALKNMTQKL